MLFVRGQWSKVKRKLLLSNRRRLCEEGGLGTEFTARFCNSILRAGRFPALTFHIRRL